MNKLIVKTKIIDKSIVMRKLQYAKDGDAEIEFEEVDELSDSERGSGGYGSTGK